VLCLVNNIIEIRVDATKLMYEMRMPLQTLTFRNQMWHEQFFMMILLGVITNLAMCYYTCFDDECLATLNAGNQTIDTVAQKIATDISDSYGQEHLITSVVGIEHILLLSILFIRVVTNDIPDSVRIDRYLQNYFSIRENEFYRSDDSKTTRSDDI